MTVLVVGAGAAGGYVSVLADLASRARHLQIDTPLLDAAMVAIDVHNRRITR